MHMLYHDRPVQKSLGFGVLVHAVAFLPTLVTVVTAVVVGVTRARRRGSRYSP
jgi:hypothetical protein